MVSQMLTVCSFKVLLIGGSCLSEIVAYATPGRRLRRTILKICGFLSPVRRFPFRRIGGFAATEYPSI